MIPSHFGKALDESVKLIAIANNDAYGVRINHAPAAPTAPMVRQQEQSSMTSQMHSGV